MKIGKETAGWYTQWAGRTIGKRNRLLFDKMQFTDSLTAGQIYVREIIRDTNNSYWVATSNLGLIHITGDVHHPSTLKFENFSLRNGKLKTNAAFCLHIDRFNRLWAGTEGGGLYMYDRIAISLKKGTGNTVFRVMLF